MAIENTAISIFIAAAFAITYMVFYKKNRFFGNLAFMAISIAIMAWDSDTNITVAIGLVLLVGSIINAVYDVLTPRK